MLDKNIESCNQMCYELIEAVRLIANRLNIDTNKQTIILPNNSSMSVIPLTSIDHYKLKQREKRMSMFIAV